MGTGAGTQAMGSWSRPFAEKGSKGAAPTPPRQGPHFPGCAGFLPSQHSAPSPATHHPVDCAACSPLDFESMGLRSRPTLALGCHRDLYGQTSDSPAAAKTPGPCSHQCAPHSHAQCTHTQPTRTHMHTSECPLLTCRGFPWGMLVPKPCWPGYLSPGGHRKGLPEPAENAAGSRQPSKEFFPQRKSRKLIKKNRKHTHKHKKHLSPSRSCPRHEGSSREQNRVSVFWT